MDNSELICVLPIENTGPVAEITTTAMFSSSFNLMKIALSVLAIPSSMMFPSEGLFSITVAIRSLMVTYAVSLFIGVLYLVKSNGLVEMLMFGLSLDKWGMLIYDNLAHLRGIRYV
tara:strand:- start:117 stop:464 length:348 start_codon:yes stop_codon:yes gene_type:complete